MARDQDHQIHELVGRQHALLTFDQARELGMSERTIRRRLASGEWESAGVGVYRLAGLPQTWEQRVLAACFANRDRPVVVCARTAAKILELKGFEHAPIELAVPYGSHLATPKVLIHRFDLMAEDVYRRGEFLMTTPTRTLIDLGSFVHPVRVRRALEDALYRDMTSEEELLDRLDLMEVKGRRKGPKVMRNLLKDRGVGAPSESDLEVMVLNILRDEGLPLPERQVPVLDADGQFIGTADLAYPSRRIAIECQGFRDHGRKTVWEWDQHKVGLVQLAGWIVLPVTWQMATRRRKEVVRLVTHALALRP